MVSCKRGTLISKQYGFVQEGHTFIEKPPKAHALLGLDMLGSLQLQLQFQLQLQLARWVAR